MSMSWSDVSLTVGQAFSRRSLIKRRISGELDWWHAFENLDSIGLMAIGDTTSHILSKVFEYCLLSRCESFFGSSENQFGLKENTGCSNAIFSARKSVENYSRLFFKLFVLKWSVRPRVKVCSITNCCRQRNAFVAFLNYRGNRSPQLKSVWWGVAWAALDDD